MSTAAVSASSPTDPTATIQTPATLLRTLSAFLTHLVHHLLYLRRIYPAQSFLSTRTPYNYPIRQSRHPSVCAWILSAVSAVEDQLAKNTVRDVSVVFFGSTSNVVWERWRIGLEELPGIKLKGSGATKGVGDFAFEREGEGDEERGSNDTSPAHGGGIVAEYVQEEQPNPTTAEDRPSRNININPTDLGQQFRAMLSRISSTASRLAPLPATADDEATFTIAIELKKDADRPVGVLTDKEERKWIAAEPEAWDNASDDDGNGSLSDGDDDDDDDEVEEDSRDNDSSTENRKKRKAKGKGKGKEKEKEKEKNDRRGKTRPVRRLEAGELRMEIWVEEAEAKFTTTKSSGAVEREMEGRGGGLGR